MLVLTRKLKQKIQIGKNITITVLRVQGNSVRIGIEAPDDVRILRAELPVDFRDGETELDVDADVSDNSPLAFSPVQGERDFSMESFQPSLPATLSRSLPVGAALHRRRASSIVTGGANRPARCAELNTPAGGVLARA